MGQATPRVQRGPRPGLDAELGVAGWGLVRAGGLPASIELVGVADGLVWQGACGVSGVVVLDVHWYYVA